MFDTLLYPKYRKHSATQYVEGLCYLTLPVSDVRTLLECTSGQGLHNIRSRSRSPPSHLRVIIFAIKISPNYEHQSFLHSSISSFRWGDAVDRAFAQEIS